MQKLVYDLKKRSYEHKANIWKRLAIDLERPTRQRRIVNLSKIDRCTKENETVVVPGKVLGAGLINHKLLIAAWQFSQQAKDKIEAAGGKTLSISELALKNPKGQRIRIIG